MNEEKVYIANFRVNGETLRAWRWLQEENYNMSRLMRQKLMEFYREKLAEKAIKRRGTFDPDDSSIGE
jgi:hypothetical protein